MKFSETSLAATYVQELALTAGIEYPIDAVEDLFKIFPLTFAGFLGTIKDKEKALSVVVNNVSDEFEMGAIVRYIPGETEEDKGSWSFVMTFDPEDVKDIKVVPFNNGNLDTHCRYFASENFGINFNRNDTMHILAIYFATTIKKFLDDNAKEGEIVSLEIPGYFVARVEVENGIKIMSIEPGEEVSQAVKYDAGEEK